MPPPPPSPIDSQQSAFEQYSFDTPAGYYPPKKAATGTGWTGPGTSTTSNEFANKGEFASTTKPSSAAGDTPAVNINHHVLKINHQNNYNIINNINISVGNSTSDDELSSAPLPYKPVPPANKPSTQPSHRQNNNNNNNTATNNSTPTTTTSSSSNPTSNPSSSPASSPTSSSSKDSTSLGSVPPTLFEKKDSVSHYAVGKTIGEGTFGKVKKGIHKLTGLPVAIKILEKEKIVDLADVERVKREIHILTRVRHPNVIRLFEVIDSPKHIFLIMDFAPGGELFDYIVAQGRVKEDVACRFFHQIVNGVDYFHNKNIIHRDLKPENLLLTADSDIKICDFGLGNVVKHGKLLKTACGSPCYAAPEMIAGKKYVGSGCDLWSLGVILFALLCGYLPFEDANTAKLYEKIMNGDYEIPDFVSGEGRDLISKLLITDPKRRYNAEQVRKHPWYARLSVGTDPLYSDDIVPLPGPHPSGRRVRRTINGTPVDDEAEVDQDIIRQMVMSGYHPQQVIESIQSNRHDHFAATYHLLLLKKQLSNKQQQKSSSRPSTSSTDVRPGSSAPQPRIPQVAASVAPGGSGAPVPMPTPPQHVSTPIHTRNNYRQQAQRDQRDNQQTSHPIQTQQPSHTNQAQERERPQREIAFHQQPTSSQPQSAREPARRDDPTRESSSRDASRDTPTSPSYGSSRVQSAGIARPSPAVLSYPPSARPTTSFAQHKPSDQPVAGPAGAWRPNTNPPTATQPSYLSISPIIDARYSQSQTYPPAPYHPHSQPNTSRPSTSSGSPPAAYLPRPPSSNGKAPKPPSVSRKGARRPQAPRKAAPVVPQTLFVTHPLELIAPAHTAPPTSHPYSTPTTPRSIVPNSQSTPRSGALSSRSSSRSGTVPRAYFDEMMHSGRPVSSAARPPSSQRPTTSSQARQQHRPPSSTQNRPGTTAQIPGYYRGTALHDSHLSAHSTAVHDARSGVHSSIAVDSGVDSLHGDGWSSDGGSKVSTLSNISAVSFKSAGSIINEIQRVMRDNEVAFSVLPPSNAAPLKQHSFAPASANGMAPMSISSFRAPSESASGSSANQIIECRRGNIRFQLFISPLTSSAYQQALGENDHSHASGIGYVVRVKRVLGEANGYRELLMKLLPQLKL